MENTPNRIEVDYAKQVGSLPRESRILFYEHFSHALTLSVRGVWSDESLDDAKKVECMKWLNEIMYRVVLKIAALRLNRNEVPEAETWAAIQHYIWLCPEIDGHVTVAAINSYQRVVTDAELPDNSLK